VVPFLKVSKPKLEKDGKKIDFKKERKVKRCLLFFCLYFHDKRAIVDE